MATRGETSAWSAVTFQSGNSRRSTALWDTGRVLAHKNLKVGQGLGPAGRNTGTHHSTAVQADENLKVGGSR